MVDTFLRYFCIFLSLSHPYRDLTFLFVPDYLPKRLPLYLNALQWLYVELPAIRSVFSLSFCNITVDGARPPLATAKCIARLIGYNFFIALISDDAPLAIFFRNVTGVFSGAVIRNMLLVLSLGRAAR
jgi:hypothetical protein